MRACVLAALATSSLCANPSNPTVVSGDVSFEQQGSVLIITSNSDRAIVDWETFSIDDAELTLINLPTSDSVLLNRVTGSTPSLFVGELQSNGGAYLINGNGITIDSPGLIDVNSFLASTLDCSDESFLTETDIAFTDTIALQSITHLGNIQIDSGDAVLIGYQVHHSGIIYATQGIVAIGSGMYATLHTTGTDRLSIEAADHIANAATAVGIDTSPVSYTLAVEAQIKADGGLYDTAIQHEGLINAQGILGHDGYILFSTENGYVNINGTAQTRNADTGFGGSIAVLGNTINLDMNCVLDTSGLTGGGVIQVGVGDLYAQSIDVSFAAQMNADANFINSGGSVVVGADQSINFAGAVTSRGGYVMGNGGFVEISSANTTFTGYVDNTAIHGRDGIFILN